MHVRARIAVIAGSALSLCWWSPAVAGGDWLTLIKDNDRMNAATEVGLGDTQQKRYAWGDVNNNGWIDLVVARKEPFTSPGKRRNVLFMNESGVLVDRTAEYASEVNHDQIVTEPGWAPHTDYPEDEGFLTPTNDRHAVLVDVTNNGWLDIVTAATFSDNDPKHIGHPRVYINLANSGGAPGEWQGFRFENARIPAMLSYTGHAGFNPRFEVVAAGDLNMDGFADLWFGDSDDSGAGGGPMPAAADFNDRLLVNVGAAQPGHFIDATSGSFSGVVPAPGGGQPFPVSSTSWAAAIADVNGSGVADIVKHSTISSPNYIGAVYNDPLNPGIFAAGSYQVIATATPTYFSLRDLNNSSKLDIVITDDGADRYRLNLGTDANGHVIWSPTMMLPEWSNGVSPSNGFGGNSVIVDLDNNGWNDIIIADVTFGIPGCSRHTNIYRNALNAPNVTFENVSSIIPQLERRGVFDVAAFDLTGNGWIDLVLGRCAGTSVWINEPPLVPCPGDLTGNNVVGVPDLLILLAAWGPVPGGHLADLDGDGQVGVSDLLILLAAWGPCS